MSDLEAGLGHESIIIQGADTPVFQGRGSGALLCSAGCGQTLIDQYNETGFLSVIIKCHRCGSTTTTPGILDGEVLPQVPAAFEGAVLLTGTVDTKGIVIVGGTSAKRSIELTTPKVYEGSIGIDPVFAENISDRLRRIPGSKIDLQRAILTRKGRPEIKNFPFVWALDVAHRIFQSKHIKSSDQDAIMAMYWLGWLHIVFESWSHHPRFAEVSRLLVEPGKSLHTLYMFIVATSLSRAGNRVGLSLEDKHGIPNPDLYQRISSEETRHIEIKAPRALQYPFDAPISMPLVKKHVRSGVDRSKAQINRYNPGVVAVVTSMFGVEANSFLHDSSIATMRAVGKQRRSLDGIIHGGFAAPKWNGSMTDFGFDGFEYDIRSVGNRWSADSQQMNFDIYP